MTELFFEIFKNVPVKEESEKVGVKLNMKKTKIMASSTTTSWEIDGETVETVPDFIFLGSKVNADGDTIQPSHPLLPPSLPTFNLSQHQGLFQ